MTMNCIRAGWQARRWCALAVCVVGLLAVVLPLRAAGPDEPLGWRVGPAAWSFNRFTFFEAVDKTSALGLRYIEAFEGQRISKELTEQMGPGIPDPVLEQVRSKLKASGVTLTSVYLHPLSDDEPAARKAFEFCRKLGAETIVSEPLPEALNLLERLCDEYGVKLAIHNHPRGKSRYWNPREVLRVCAGRSPRMGACADVGHWQRSGIRPVDGVRLLGSRLLSLNVKDLSELGPEGHDVPWGTGKGEMAEMLREIHRLGVRPTLFAIEYEYNWENNVSDVARLRRVLPADRRRDRGARQQGRASRSRWAGRRSISHRRGRSRWSDNFTSEFPRACATRSPPPSWPWKHAARAVTSRPSWSRAT